MWPSSLIQLGNTVGSERGHRLSGFEIEPAHVRTEEDVVEGEQGMIGWWRFLLEHVEASSRQLPRLQRFDESRFIDQSAP